MRTRNRIAALLGVLASTLLLVTALGVVPAHAVTIGVTLENITESTPHPFMNRSGGGHVIGTPIGGYGTFDDNDDFTFEWYPTTKCGDNHVHSTNGQACPFTNGSGLNARYEGADILAIHEYTWGFYATIPNFSTSKLALGDFGAQGDTFVRNAAGYVVSVGQSNYDYAHGGGANNPQWIDSTGVSGAQLVAAGPANSGPWDCSTVGNAHQDAC